MPMKSILPVDEVLEAVLAWMLEMMELAREVKVEELRLLSDDVEDCVADTTVFQIEERSMFIV